MLFLSWFTFFACWVLLFFQINTFFFLSNSIQHQIQNNQIRTNSWQIGLTNSYFSYSHTLNWHQSRLFIGVIIFTKHWVVFINFRIFAFLCFRFEGVCWNQSDVLLKELLFAHWILTLNPHYIITSNSKFNIVSRFATFLCKHNLFPLQIAYLLPPSFVSSL